MVKLSLTETNKLLVNLVTNNLKTLNLWKMRQLYLCEFHSAFRVEAVNSYLQESSKELVCKEEAITKRVRTIEGNLARVEEYTLQILDILGNLQLPVAGPSEGSPENDEHVAPRDSDSRGWDSEGPFSRLMSVPAYMHMQQRQSSQGSGMPLYFRRKIPTWNARRPKQPSQSQENQRRGSVHKAISRFKRSNTLSSLDETLSAMSGEVPQQQLANTAEARSQDPTNSDDVDRQLLLKRASSASLASGTEGL